MKILITVLFTFLGIQLISQDYIVNDFKNASYFPSTIGSQWTYSRLNNFTDVVDIVRVSIIADTIIDNVDFKIWEYEYDTHQEKFYYSNSPDSIIVLNSFFRIVQEYLIPFEIGTQNKFDDFHEYGNNYQIESNKVLDKHEVMIGFKLFTCYLILHKGLGNNDYLTEKIWIKEGIGVVKIERHCWSIGCSMNETWNLVGCKI